MKITIGGPSGTGKGTVAKKLAEILNYKFYSGGDFFREMAKELGMTVYEFDEYVKKHSEYDLKMEERQKRFGKENDNFILEARLSWFAVPDAFKIKLDCELEERLKRIADRDESSLEEIRKKTLGREKAYKERYNKLYGIQDPISDGHFDFIVDTTNINPDEVVEVILKKLEKYGKIER